MIIPHSLNSGDKIAIIAPCSPVESEFIQPAADFIENLGYIPELFPSCFCECGYLAGEDCQRAADINDAFANPNITGIIAIRGGYGGARLAKYLDYGIIRANPKMFCGFSDVTVLHIMLNKFCNLATFHTPMPANEAMRDDKFSRSCLADVLCGNYPNELVNYSCKLKCLCEGHSDGVLTGGNLTVIASTIGTPYEIETCDKILFLEDVNESAYAIDRCLIQLRDSGKLDCCRGIILGTWKNCKMPRNSPDYVLSDLFKEIFEPLHIPVIGNLQCGHSVPSMSIPLGFVAEIYAHADDCRILIRP